MKYYLSYNLWYNGYIDGNNKTVNNGDIDNENINLKCLDNNNNKMKKALRKNVNK